MTDATPADAHDIGARVHARWASILGCHVLCREHALCVIAAAEALGVYAELVQEPGHYVVTFEDGSRSENYFGNVRMRPPA